MTQSVPDEAVISRIRKLMTVTIERGSSENEATMAAAHVQRLLAMHNLDMAQLEASGKSSGEGGNRKKSTVSNRRVYKWLRKLMIGIAKSNFCYCSERYIRPKYFRPAIFDGYDLIGREDNVISTVIMFDYLVSTIDRLQREDVNNDASQFFTRYAHSFKEGCADRLIERLEAQRKDMEREQREAVERVRLAGGTGGALMLLTDVAQNEIDLNNDFLRQWEPGTTAANRTRARIEEAEAKRKFDEKYEKFKSEGHPEKYLYYLACGFTLERVKAIVDAPVEDKPETEAQARRRHDREKRQEERSNERYWRDLDRESKRLDRHAYNRGVSAGSGVSLDRQLPEGKDRLK